MILRILFLAMALALPLSAAKENTKTTKGAELFAKSCNGCNSCRQKPSLAELLQQVEAVLNSNVLFLPQLQPQLIALVARIIAEGGGVIPPIPPSGILDFADFFALMPGDNAATVAIGGDVSFPQDGPSSGTGLIARLGANAFNLATIGVYEVLFQVSVTEPGQLVLTLNSGGGAVVLGYTLVGRAGQTNQIVGMALVRTSVINSILTVRNNSSASALTITPSAGGTAPVSAHLVITRIQ